MALNIRIKYKHYYISPESLMFNRSQEAKENSSAAKGKNKKRRITCMLACTCKCTHTHEHEYTCTYAQLVF